MKRILAVVAVWFLLTPYGTFNVAHAQTSTMPSVSSEVEKSIHTCEQEVARWRRQAFWEITLAIAVIVFGVVVSGLQRSSAQWARNLTLILGICTAALTGINSRVFLADDRSLQRAAFEGEAVISQLWVMAGSMKDASSQDKSTINEDYLKKLAEFRSIGEKLSGNGAANSGSENAQNGWGGLPVVYAQSTGVPGWTQKPPSDGTSLYYVGKGSDPSLSDAKQKSMDNALQSVVLALRSHAPTASDPAILALVKASALIQDSAFTYDPEARNYTYFTLLRLSREIQSIGVASLPAATSAQSPSTKIQRGGWIPADLSYNPISGMFALDATGGISKLAADQYSPSLIEKLFRVVGGYALTATPDSIFVASTTQLGCKVYKYSLLTRALSQRLVAAREHCGGIATDGKAVYLSSHDRNEIIWLDSWEASSARRWTVQGANSPDSLTFDIFGHRLIVADAAGKAYAVSVSDGKTRLLASNLGDVTSITTSPFCILFASGKKVLFLARTTNQGVNPPAGLQSLTGGHIVGIAVDKNVGLWFADFDKRLVEGPFAII